MFAQYAYISEPTIWEAEKYAEPIQPTTPSSSLLPALSSLLGAAGQVGSAYLGYRTVKERAEQVTTQPIQVISTTPAPTITPVQAGMFPSMGSILPILAIVGVGAFLLMRGKKK